MKTVANWMIMVLAVATISACDKPKGETEAKADDLGARSAAANKQSQAAAKPATKASPATTGGGDTKAATAPAGDNAVTPGKEATPFIGTASAVPTMGEWKAQTREVTVTGSSKLNCETKMVREWLRVSCRGKNSDGGKPVSVKVLSGGGHGGDFVYSQAEVVASLVVRFKPGVDLEARFKWTNTNRVLHVYWPNQSPEPPYKAKFR